MNDILRIQLIQWNGIILYFEIKLNKYVSKLNIYICDEGNVYFYKFSVHNNMAFCLLLNTRLHFLSFLTLSVKIIKNYFSTDRKYLKNIYNDTAH